MAVLMASDTAGGSLETQQPGQQSRGQCLAGAYVIKVPTLHFVHQQPLGNRRPIGSERSYSSRCCGLTPRRPRRKVLPDCLGSASPRKGSERLSRRAPPATSNLHRSASWGNIPVSDAQSTARHNTDLCSKELHRRPAGSKPTLWLSIAASRPGAAELSWRGADIFVTRILADDALIDVLKDGSSFDRPS